MAEPVEGGCRCGRIRLGVSAPPLLTMACHCMGCHRMTASAYSLSAAFAAEAFEVTAGEPVIGGLHGASRHHHCPHCKSWLFTQPQGLDWLVNVRPTMLDDLGWTEPFVETMTDEKLPWATTPAVHSYPGFPPPEDYERLLAEFADWR